VRTTRNLPCVPLAVLYASILSLVVVFSAAIVDAIVSLLRQKSAKCQHPWQMATSSRLLCLVVSCGILAQVLLALPQFCTHAAFWRGTFEAAPRWQRGRGRGPNLSRRERRQNAQLLEFTFLVCCSWLVPLRFVIVFPCGLNFSASPWSILHAVA